MPTALETNFFDIVKSTARTESFLIQWDIGQGNLDDYLLISDSRVAHSPGQFAQTGLDSIVEITEEAGVGLPHNKTATFELFNKEYVGLTGANPRKLAEIAHGRPLLGSQVIIRALISDGDDRGSGSEYIQPTIFVGIVVNIQYGERITVTAQQATSGGLPCPVHVLNGGIHPEHTAGEPEEVEGSKGKVIPFGIGRFDASALKDWGSTHPFGIEGKYTTVGNELNANYSDICATFPAQLGVKHPMLPVLITHEKVRTTGGSNPDDWTGFVACYGSCVTDSPGGKWDLDVRSEDVTTSVYNHSFPGYNIGLETTAPVVDAYSMRWTHAWSWLKTPEVSRGLPFIQDSHAHGETYLTDLLTILGAAEISIARDHAGTGEPCFGMFFPSRNSDTVAPASPHRKGLLQSVAVPFDRVGTRGGSVIYGSPGPAVVSCVTNAANPENMFDGDPETSTTINSDEYVCLQLPSEFQSLGDLVSARVVALIDTVNTDADLHISARQTPNYGPFEDLRADFNCASNGYWTSGYHGNKFLYGQAALGGTLHKWVSVNLFPLIHDTNQSAKIIQAASAAAPAEPNLYHQPGFHEQWKFLSWGYDAGFQLLFSPEVIFFVRGVAVKVTIYEAWMECIFKSRFAMGIRSLDQKEGFYPKLSSDFGNGPANRQYFDVRGRRLGDRAVVYPISNIPQQTEPSSYTPMFLSGRGVRDVEAGTWTGTAYGIIERPDHVARVILEHFTGASIETTASTFGSFVDAGTSLSGFIDKQTLVVDKPGVVSNVLNQIGTQSSSFMYEDRDINNTLKWKMFVDSPTLASSRRFLSGNHVFDVAAKDSYSGMVPGSFRIIPTDLDDIVTRLTLHYGYHIPTGSYSNKHFVSPTECSFSTEATTYKDRSTAAETAHNVVVATEVYANDVWNSDVAEALCKWWFDQKRYPRVGVEFKTYAIGMALRPGHWIRISDSIGAMHPYPGYDTVGGSLWNSRRFIVNQTIVNQDGPFITVTVRCLEHYKT